MVRREHSPPGVRPTLPSWWLDEALAAEDGGPQAPPLEGDLRVDVAIVGGGYTGLWTALALRERDPAVSVAVLEAEICGWGPSGRNGGFLNGYWTHLSRLRPVFGDGGALAIAHAGAGAVPAVRAFCEARGEDVWLREGGYLKVSAAPAQDAAVERSIRTAAELGVAEEAVPLSAEEVASRCRSQVFRRGVFFRDGATVQPARLARALRRAALSDGIALHERTRVTGLRAGRPAVLETPRGTVRADEVIVATNAALAGWRPFSRYLTNFGSYVVLTEPVPELLEEIGWTGGEAITDGRMFIHYFRTTPDGRVLMGSGSGPIGVGGRLDERFTHDEATARRAEAGLRRLLRPSPARASSEPGAARSTSRSTTSPSSERSREPASTMGWGTPATGSAPPGSAVRSWPRSPSRAGTSGAPRRSYASPPPRFHPSRSSASAEGPSGPRPSL